MKIIPLWGSGTRYKSSTVVAQRRVNCYYENRVDQDKAKVVIYGTPGTIQFSKVGTVPVRGIIGSTLSGNTSFTGLFLVAGSFVLGTTSLGPNPTYSSAVFPTSTGLVSMAIQNSPNQMVIVDGLSGYNVTLGTGALTGTLSVSTISSFPATGARTVTFVSNFFVAEQPGTQKFWVSNFNDATTWNALAFASASAYPDNILAVDNLLGNLVVFSLYHTEFWQNIGSTPQPFAPLLSAVNEYGLAAIFSRAHVDQSLIFLAQTRTGSVQAVQIVGYNANVISDADIDEIWNSFPVVSDAVALSYQIGQHKVYQITFPTANRSFIFDCATRIWSETQTGVSEVPVRHTANLSTVWFGQTILTDYATGVLYSQNEAQYTDNAPSLGSYSGTPIMREVISRHVLSSFNRIRISFIYIDMEVGAGLPPFVGSNLNSLANGPAMVMFQYSWDNGVNWSKERWISLGAQGEYRKRVTIRRLRSARDFVFKIRMTDPVKFVITDGAIKMNERQPAEKLA